MKKLSWLVLFLTLVFMNAYAGRTTLSPLKAEDAFNVSVAFTSINTVTAMWDIAPGYYLYAKNMSVDLTPTVSNAVHLPPGTWQNSKILGRFLAYTNKVTVPVTFPENTPEVTMTLSYQGCSESGFCYPPMQKSFIVNVAAQSISGQPSASSFSLIKSLRALLSDQEGVRILLSHLSPAALLILFLVLGLLLAFTPCVLPMVPILTSIIVGQKHALGTGKAFLLSFTYVLGVAITYACAGLAAASLGGTLQVWLQQPITIIVVSGIFVLLALSLFGLYELRFSRRWHNKIANWSDKHHGGTYVGVFCMGILSTLVVSPCVTAPLAGVLIYVAQTGNLWFGASTLFVMGLGMGIPLLLIGTSAGKWIPKSGPWMKAIKEFFGIFMVAMAVWLLSRIISFTATQVLMGILLLGTGLYVGMYLPHLIKFRKTNAILGSVVGLLGIIMLANAFQSNTKLQQAPFVIVQNINELKHQLAKAHAAHQAVLVDFYASWCASCVEMDKQVFEHQPVQQALKNFILLRVDLSANTAADYAMLKQFNVIAPPTVLLFGPQGKEINAHRIVGDVNADDFLARLQSFKQANCQDKEIMTC